MNLPFSFGRKQFLGLYVVLVAVLAVVKHCVVDPAAERVATVAAVAPWSARRAAGFVWSTPRGARCAIA